MIKFVPATSDALLLVAGEAITKTVKAIAVVDGDTVIGVGGFYLDKNKAIIFSYITEALRRHPVSLVKATKIVIQWAQRLRVPICAVCDGNIVAAARFLKHLGFEHLNGDVWLLQSR